MSVSACSLPPLSLNPTKTGIINVHWSKGNGRQKKWSPKERREKWSNGMKQQQKQLCSSCRTFLRLRRLLRSTLPPWLRTAVNASAAALCPPAAHTHTHKRSAAAWRQNAGYNKDRGKREIGTVNSGLSEILSPSALFAPFLQWKFKKLF